MKKILLISALASLSFTSSVMADSCPDRDIYVGIQGGLGFNNMKDFSARSFPNGSYFSHISNSKGLVGRVFVGYDINQIFALESGYSYFFNDAYMHVSTGNDVGYIKTQSLDLYGKLKAPAIRDFGLYAKFGVGLLMNNFQHVVIGDNIRRNFNAAFGVGVDYNITTNIVTNLEWSHIIGYHAIAHNYQPSTDAFMLGLRYKFAV